MELNESLKVFKLSSLESVVINFKCYVKSLMFKR